ncbi:replicative DNA helicase [Vibrio ishigakensis]|uniref:Replicative DNA helicase n=1 Tax=Vibrio ishigakensis TaxID=1481914 RepID=A0A0B8QP55_9VIBR|nr:replicative DNA helicase [Vibrio ishigakensis]
MAERAVVRNLIGVANEIADAGYDPQGRTSGDLVDLAESKVFAIAEERGSENEGPQNVENILEKTLERIEVLYQTPQDGVTGVSTGFNDLNKKTAGLQPSDLVIVQLVLLWVKPHLP